MLVPLWLQTVGLSWMRTRLLVTGLICAVGSEAHPVIATVAHVHQLVALDVELRFLALLISELVTLLVSILFVAPMLLAVGVEPNQLIAPSLLTPQSHSAILHVLCGQCICIYLK